MALSRYGIFNFAGALADVAADLLRTHDFVVPRWLAPLAGGAAWSGLRVHLLGTWFAVLASLAVAIPYLHDVVIVPLHEPASPLCSDASSAVHCASSPPASRFMEVDELERLRASATPQQLRQGFVVAPDPRRKKKAGRSTHAKPAPAPPLLGPRAWGAAAAAAARSWASLCELLRMRVFWRALWCSCCLLLISKQWCSTPSYTYYLLLSTSCGRTYYGYTNYGRGDLDQILPAYLERNYGEGVPIYRIHSINTYAAAASIPCRCSLHYLDPMWLQPPNHGVAALITYGCRWICMLGPSIAAAFTSDLEAWSATPQGGKRRLLGGAAARDAGLLGLWPFSDAPGCTAHSLSQNGAAPPLLHRVAALAPPTVAALAPPTLLRLQVMLPGLWIMAVSPLPLVLFPGVAATALWVGLMSLGEVIWSPRQSAWVAGLAPDGREGVFLALLSLKSLITTIPSTALNGYLNSAFVPNCPQCRDSHGHFCAAPRALAPDEAAQGWLGRGLEPAAHFACASEVEACVGTGFAEQLSAANLTDLTGLRSCPQSCAACPGWAGDGRTLWLIVLLTSLSSPVMVTLTLNFLRGREATAAPAAAAALAAAPADATDVTAAAPADAPADAARDVRLRGLTPLRLTRPLSGT